ncbi:ABC transporter ATP-binding protein [Caproiciproducens sp. NJN-50]|nr:ABC transporter ATP-binding protein [Caproiciproducens sp. NJN-50]
MFELEGVSFSYPGCQPVLDDVRFTICKGERVCILGANGCGKSTLLKLLSGLLSPQKGIFRAFHNVVSERDWNDDHFSGKYHRQVGFIFQNPDVQLFCSTVEDEIAFGLLQQKLDPETVRSRISDISALLGIENLLGKTPYKLSGGEKKKVALASVLVMNPEVLILDEPTNGLDPRTQVWLIRLLNSLGEAGKTIITSTHNLELVSKISDRGILFSEEHKIAADSRIDDLIGNIDLLKSVNLVDEYYGI